MEFLVEEANQDKTNEDGIYTSVVVLSELQPGALLEQREEIVKFLEFAKSIGPRTKTSGLEVEE